MNRPWLNEPRFLRLSWMLLVFMTLFAGQFIHHNFFNAQAGDAQPGRDFLAFYAAGWMAWHGQALASYDLASLHAAQLLLVPGASAFAWYYPPTALLLNAPLAWLPHTGAYLTFMALTLSLFALACWRNWPDRRTLFAVLGFTGITVNIVFGQNGLLTAALFLLAWADLRQQPLRAGFWLALLALKPHLLLLWLPMLLATRQWRALFAFVLFSSLLVLLSIVAFGHDIWLAWWHGIAQAQANLASGKLPWDKMISVYADLRLIGMGTTGAGLAQVAAGLLALLLCTGVWRRSTDNALRGSALALGTLCISPYLYDYELAWLGIALLLLCRRGISRGFAPGEIIACLLLWLYPVIDMLLLDPIKPSASPIIILALLMRVYGLACQDATNSHYASATNGYSVNPREDDVCDQH